MTPQNTSSQNSQTQIGQMGKWKKQCILVVSILSVILLIIFIYFAFNSNSASKLKIDIGGQIIDIDIKNDQIKVSDLINKLFETEESKVQTHALLREFHKLYYVDDPNLINLIESIDESAFLSQKLRELLIELKGPFKRNLHSFYDIKNAKIADAIEKLGYEHEVSKALRKLLVYRKGPFASQEREIHVSVPTGNHIKEGFAASCRNNDFFRKNIRIFDQSKQNSIDVYVKGPIGRSENQSELKKLIHLSYNDIKKLIGDSPVQKREPAYAIIELE